MTPSMLCVLTDCMIRIYDTSREDFKLMKVVAARDVGWSVLDIAISPNGQQFVYSSWSEYIHICDIYGKQDNHAALFLSPEDRRFCIFSLRFSHDGKEILGSANDECIYVYDRELNKRSLKVRSHEGDVNAIDFADATSQIIFSGGDDGLCKVWDRRTLNDEYPQPVGILAGHLDGITYIDPKGDGRHLITNSKDQTVKLWDMRAFSPSETVKYKSGDIELCIIKYKSGDTELCIIKYKSGETELCILKYKSGGTELCIIKYKSGDIELCIIKYKSGDTELCIIKYKSVANHRKKLTGDTSLMTYREHSVFKTLIRCHFSPDFTTGQRFIYTGCESGSIIIYDVLTGKTVKILPGHRGCVRDVSWHPFRQELVSTSWDGTLRRWTHSRKLVLDSDDDREFERTGHLGLRRSRRIAQLRRKPQTS
ncbi:LEC14B protein-like [Limulus polyphemus]|uniref:LEC14B protein-like n=1 Tax=Limulus polyphemus TaxID=6850 RepID=A0ABM1C0A2_LIMPO|nr:LEC14B protein-like [Limulus polyphemus]